MNNLTKNLTLVAALPMGGGCMSSLPAEKNQVPFEKADGISPDPGSVLLDMIEWQREQAELLAALRRSPPQSTNPLLQVKSKEPTVQMKAAYFEESKEIDWTDFDLSGLTGGFGC